MSPALIGLIVAGAVALHILDEILWLIVGGFVLGKAHESSMHQRVMRAVDLMVP